jgi:hypothetical protein
VDGFVQTSPVDWPEVATALLWMDASTVEYFRSVQVANATQEALFE